MSTRDVSSTNALSQLPLTEARLVDNQLSHSTSTIDRQTQHVAQQHLTLVSHAMSSDTPTVGQIYRHPYGVKVNGQDASNVKVGTPAKCVFQPLIRKYLRNLPQNQRIPSSIEKYPQKWGVHEAVEKSVVACIRWIVSSKGRETSSPLKITCLPATSIYHLLSIDMKKCFSPGEFKIGLETLPDLYMEAVGESKQGDESLDKLNDYLEDNESLSKETKFSVNEEFDFEECKDLSFESWTPNNTKMIGSSDLLYLGETELTDELMINFYAMLKTQGKLVFIETITQKNIDEFDQLFNELDPQERESVTISPNRQTDFEDSFDNFKKVPEAHLGVLAKKVKELESVGFLFGPLCIKCCGGGMYVFQLGVDKGRKNI